MKKILLFVLALCLVAALCTCGTNEPKETTKTSLAIAELAEDTYTGTMPGDEYTTNSEVLYMTLSHADISVTIENGQITLYCKAVSSAYGILWGVKTPQSPEGSMILSGSLPLQQSGDAVTAEGEVPLLGESLILNYRDSKFTSWELQERNGDKMFDCTVRIAMENGVPIATITAGGASSSRTATVPLALK